MNLSKLFLLLFCASCFSQTSIKATFIDATALTADHLIAIDNFGTLYYTKNNIFNQVKANKPALNYSNVQLGIITSVNAFNPLKINIFYQDFNTVVILDNRLAEIYKIDFNTIQPYKNVTHISTGYDNTIWIFNQDLQQLELFDYKTERIRVTTIPVQSNVLDLKSDYNHCWMLTEKFLYQYSYFGSLISKIKNEGFKAIAVENENCLIQTSDSYLYKAKDREDLIPLAMPKLLINQFLLANQTLYIYELDRLHRYQLKIK
ncbi:hypothetical protein ESY86_02365 [Subsaximicrobium wynnwilliamsii]|uniref:Uncharacterized protein n=1 Tax=Subsaximicrobium wynnwilliamsii TaxID=291179 RepID=A0A5C6ZNC9_9FLAO|nr:hypothetical protein [Subsaximicrobium wynnwilliamsii]TXD85471.1 hypothetical protein ESY87_00675 [Subsaximicrobium wynnwilliamsii]TXD90824.1 hypothetical protein ESY86_02365 [Subsaximicrobium wynnwilliamsii]TXE05331.1 hypothetical protein ESY88_00675 [Subsaximicrobium wynnwilliamsii]